MMSDTDELILVAEGLTQAVRRKRVSKNLQGVYQEHGSRGAWQEIEQDMTVKETRRGVVDIKENLKIGPILMKD